jgi:glycosyltransferase involved in cell wall biosynthesis
MLKYFPELGIETSVISVDPQKASYPLLDPSLEKDVHKDIRVYRTPTREFYNLYKKLTGRSEIPFGGFVNEQKADLKQIVSRIIRSHFFIPDPRKGWNRFAYHKAAELIVKEGIDTIITATPPHSTQLVGMKLKKRFNIKWIADLQDPWTDIYYYNQLYHSKISAAIDSCYERRVLENADYIITVSEAIRRIFIAKSKQINPGNIIVVPNGYDEDDFKGEQTSNKGSFIITYTGTINDDYYPVDSFLAATQKIASQGKEILLRFVGKVSPKAMQKIREAKGIHVEFIDYVPHEESLRYLMKSNALLLIIPDIEQNEGILTGKLFEYLGSGRRIIGIGPSHGDAAKIIRECGSGEMLDYVNSVAIEKYINEAMEAGSDTFHPNLKEIENYSRRSQARLIAKLF